MDKINVDLKFYAVRSKDGKWLRAKGFGGGGDNWVENITKARIYPRIGPARTQVTFWTNNYPDFGIPDIVELHCNFGTILNEDDRVKKVIEKKKQNEINNEIWRSEMRIKSAQKELEEAQKKLSLLKK